MCFNTILYAWYLVNAKTGVKGKISTQPFLPFLLETNTLARFWFDILALLHGFSFPDARQTKTQKKKWVWKSNAFTIENLFPWFLINELLFPCDKTIFIHTWLTTTITTRKKKQWKNSVWSVYCNCPNRLSFVSFATTFCYCYSLQHSIHIFPSCYGTSTASAPQCGDQYAKFCSIEKEREYRDTRHKYLRNRTKEYETKAYETSESAEPQIVIQTLVICHEPGLHTE